VRRSVCRWSTNGGLLTVLEQAHGESEERRFGGACCGLLPIETVVAVKHRLSIHHCKLQIYRSFEQHVLWGANRLSIASSECHQPRRSA
jgi:hypothetical protein